MFGTSTANKANIAKKRFKLKHKFGSNILKAPLFRLERSPVKNNPIFNFFPTYLSYHKENLKFKNKK